MKRDDRSWLREQRLTLYGEVVALVAKIDRLVNQLSKHSFTPGDGNASESATEPISDALHSLQTSIGRLQVIASVPVVNAALKLGTNVATTYSLLLEAILEKLPVDEWVTKTDEMCNQFTQLNNEMIDAMRKDMGTES